MSLPTAPYLIQSTTWPEQGQHVLAHFDEHSIVVYQAYRPAIGHYAIRHGRLDGPDFSLNRMSWIKPNFLWMMFRSGWGTKPGQEVTLGLRLRRTFFDEVLAAAVPSSHDSRLFADRVDWQRAVAASDVRLQWDPDHAPDGTCLSRRAVQLGLRGEALARFAHRELIEVIDMSPFVAAQRASAAADWSALMTPTESVYTPTRNSES